MLEINKSSGIDDLGGIKWQLLLCLMAVFLLVFFCCWKGTKSTGKVRNSLARMQGRSFSCEGARSVTLLERCKVYTSFFDGTTPLSLTSTECITFLRGCKVRHSLARMQDTLLSREGARYLTPLQGCWARSFLATMQNTALSGEGARHVTFVRGCKVHHSLVRVRGTSLSCEDAKYITIFEGCKILLALG